jgi:two-component system chemotaxis sensor kinase CheA
VSLRSTLGQGTCFSLRVPLSLALLRVLLMRASGQHFALPLSAVEGVVSVTWSELEAVQGQPALDWGEQLLPVASLAQALQLPGPASEPAVEPAVVVGASGRSFAIVVDAIVGEENIVAKPVPPLLGRIQAVSAAAPLSESEMAIVLHPQELLERARQSGPVEPAAHRETGPHRILVVDDSVATRELERSILQAAGYIVETAVDGLDAWRRLADEPFDLVVADVEMPGLDGFALTERLRAAPRFEGLPVVIVSARSSDEDRRRGLEAGAQAYIVKSAFDQTNLLDTVERLLR